MKSVCKIFLGMGVIFRDESNDDNSSALQNQTRRMDRDMKVLSSRQMDAHTDDGTVAEIRVQCPVQTLRQMHACTWPPAAS